MSEYAGTELATAVAVRGGHAERRAVDCDRHLRLRHRRAAVPAVQRARRRRGARHHDDSDHRAHHRGAAAAGAARRCAKARWRSGATRGRAVHVVLPAALPGIITGVVLALARIAGETAPLLFTAFNNRFLSTDLDAADRLADGADLHLRDLAYEDWHRQAWAGALVLVTLVLICSSSLASRPPAQRLQPVIRGCR